MDFSLPIAEIDQSLLESAALAVALGVDPLVEIPVAATWSALSVPEVKAKIREGTYPEPVQVGLRKRALRLSQVKDWIANPTLALHRTASAAAGDDDLAGGQA